jgi:hypothetical protein
MAIDKLSINDLLIDNLLGAQSPEDTPNEDSIDPQQPDPTSTPDPTNRKTHRQQVGVENGEGTAYGKETELYNKYGKRSEQWNPWNPSRSARDLQHTQLCCHQTNTWID